MAKETKNDSPAEGTITLLKESKELIKLQQNEFRMDVQQLIKNNMDEFEANLRGLDPKDFCDVFIKMIPFGFGRAPEEKVKKDDDTGGDVLIERTRVVKRLTDDD